MNVDAEGEVGRNLVLTKLSDTVAIPLAEALNPES